jgi:hypothetical protein
MDKAMLQEAVGRLGAAVKRSNGRRDKGGS